jgi:hypothetical protein
MIITPYKYSFNPPDNDIHITYMVHTIRYDTIVEFHVTFSTVLWSTKQFVHDIGLTKHRVGMLFYRLFCVIYRTVYTVLYSITAILSILYGWEWDMGNIQYRTTV